MATLLTAALGNPHGHAETHFATFYDNSPLASELVAGVNYDTIIGTAVIPAVEDVRVGVAVGASGVGTLLAGGGGESWG